MRKTRSWRAWFAASLGGADSPGRLKAAWLVAWAAWPVFAQQAGGAGEPQAAPGSQQAVTLGEVMVTANRRREPSREVPMHVDQVPAERLQQLGARTLSDYAGYQPGVFYASQGGSGQGELIMRGISTGNQTSPTVSVYVDDVPIGGSTVYAASATFLFDAALMDLDHIEYLYGPQGTLYGAGSMGGLVKYVTNQPDTGAFSGSAGFDISHTERAGMNYTERATVNLPLRQGVAALRASVFDQHTAGLYRAVGEAPARGADRSHTQGARVQLQVDPVDKLSINLSAMGQRIDADGLSMADYSLATGRPLSGGPYHRRLNRREPYRQTIALYALRASYDFGWANLDWISSYQNFVNRSDQDYPDAFLALLNAFGPALGVDRPLDTLYVDSIYTVHKTSQELRLTSRKGERVDWLAGLWLNRENVWQDYGLLGDNRAPATGKTGLIAQRTSSRFQEYAGYGDLTWHLGPRWDLTAGVRASGDSQRLASEQSGPVTGGGGGFGAHRTGSDITKMLTLSYRPGRNDSYYMRASTGYRPGGLQAPLSSVLVPGGNAKNSFGADDLQSYELGYKGSRLGGRLNYGINAYDIEWHHVQLITYALGNTIIENAGDARADGVEMQASYASGAWSFEASGAYGRARLIQSDPRIGLHAGDPLPYAARRTATLSARYRFSVAGQEAYAGAVARFSSRRHAGFADDSSDPDFKLPGYAMLDLNAGIRTRAGARVDVYLRNALDRRVALGTLNAQAINFLASVGGPMLVQQSTPRTLGVSVNVPFE